MPYIYECDFCGKQQRSSAANVVIDKSIGYPTAIPNVPMGWKIAVSLANGNLAPGAESEATLLCSLRCVKAYSKKIGATLHEGLQP